nr:hypothetical protein [Angustibacter aerolatus]
MMVPRAPAVARCGHRRERGREDDEPGRLPRARGAPMQIDKQTVIDLIKNRGDHDQAAQAESEPARPGRHRPAPGPAGQVRREPRRACWAAAARAASRARLGL